MISEDSKVLFVDDGSTDRTWEIILDICKNSHGFMGIRLTANCGHQIALLAGIEYAVNDADILITIDADLQQDVTALHKFIEKYNSGCDIVYGIRNNRDADGFFKKSSAMLYYSLLKKMGCDIVKNSADYRLLSKRAAKSLLQYRERNLFLRGIIPSLGYRTGRVYFNVDKREAGHSKYSIRKMLDLAFDGVSSFSIRPIRIMLGCGVMIAGMSFLMLIYVIVMHFLGRTVSGWTSLAAAIWFLGGLNLTCLGIIGEYVGKTYIESKHRPHYFIWETTGNCDTQEPV